MENKKIYLTLSGGAAKGLVHIYVIKKLISLGYEIEAISGASSGAIIGGMFASGMSIEEIEDVFRSKEFKKILKNKLKHFNFKIFNIFNPSIGLFSTKKFYKFLNKTLNNKTFKDCKIPFSVSQTNVITGKIEYIRSGNLAEEIVKSMSFPFVFESYDGIHYDGGILENLSVDYELFNDINIPKIGVTVQKFSTEDKKCNTSMVKLAKRIIIDLLWENIYRKDISEVDYNINIPVDFNFFDFYKLFSAWLAVHNWFRINYDEKMFLKKKE